MSIGDDLIVDGGTEETSDAASLSSIQIRRPRQGRPGAPHKRSDLTRALAKRRVETDSAAGYQSQLRQELAAVMPGPPRPTAAARPQPVGIRPRLVPQPPQQARDIVSFWSLQRAGRRFPTRADLDPARVAEYWPNTLLLRFHPAEQTLELEAIISPHGRGGPAAVEFTPMVLEWILSLGRKVARIGQPLSETEQFPGSFGTIRYRASALPLSDSQLAIDHILCHVARS